MKASATAILSTAALVLTWADVTGAQGFAGMVDRLQQLETRLETLEARASEPAVDMVGEVRSLKRRMGTLEVELAQVQTEAERLARVHGEAQRHTASSAHVAALTAQLASLQAETRQLGGVVAALNAGTDAEAPEVHATLVDHLPGDHLASLHDDLYAGYGAGHASLVPHVTTALSAQSRHERRGHTIIDGPSLQPAAHLAWDGAHLEVHLGAALETDRHHAHDELAAAALWRAPLRGLQMVLGAETYWHPQAHETEHELVAGIDVDVAARPQLRIYRVLGHAAATQVELAVHPQRVLDQRNRVTVGATARAGVGDAGLQSFAFHDAGVSAWLRVPAGRLRLQPETGVVRRSADLHGASTTVWSRITLLPQ